MATTKEDEEGSLLDTSGNSLSHRKSEALRSDNYIKPEPFDDYENESDSAPPSPRMRQKRQCAELAIKKIKLEMQPAGHWDPNREKKNGPDSREGSCDRSECALQKTCSLNLISSCLKTMTDACGKNFYHITKGEHVCGP
ncbi:unnamed protein product [Strongylus vulgaris]|uniref:Uncharacterized protein n=1 Tax=Strongylus vulgaris TaxID=40348 RepID=A0A3P7JV44_STRVU|nr:unnamed protein product [Strongylus vulgaris]